MKSQHAGLTVRRTFCYVVLIILAFLSLFPFYILLVNSSRSHMQIMTNGFSALPSKYFFTNFINLFTNKNEPIVSALINSVIVSASVAVLTTYFSSMTAYGIYMYNFKGKKAAFKFILAIMMVPAQVSTLGFIKLVTRLHMIDSLSALIVPAIAAPVVFFYMYQAMESTLPYSIVEAARVDGCHEFLTFNTIVMPMMKPSIAVQAIFSFVSSWNNYFVPALVISSKNKKTIPILIAQLRSADFTKFDMGRLYAEISFAIIPLIIVYLLLSRYIISGATAGGVKE